MLIKDSEITGWVDLEAKVKQFFEEMGYRAESPKMIALCGRGQKEIDVYVEDKRASVTLRILVECKWWDTSVPQETVHAFHTVMAGTGANAGFIVSKKGFQSGAREAAQSTNINLRTFEDLQGAYGNEWYRHQLNQLNEAVAGIREERALFFDQFSPLAIPNSMRFHTPEQRQRLRQFDMWSRCLISLAERERPRSFDVEGPIVTRAGPNAPWSLEYIQKAGGHKFASVREYFAVTIEASRRWATEFADFQHQVYSAFDGLPPDRQSELMTRNLLEFAEETPIRVLRECLPRDQYVDLLARLQLKAAEMLNQSGPADGQTGGSQDQTKGATSEGATQ